jgi:hypothetical protein
MGISVKAFYRRAAVKSDGYPVEAEREGMHFEYLYFPDLNLNTVPEVRSLVNGVAPVGVSAQPGAWQNVMLGNVGNQQSVEINMDCFLYLAPNE